MMAFLACGEVPDDVVPMFLQDLHFDGATRGPSRGATTSRKMFAAEASTIVIGCGEAGLLAGIRLAQAGSLHHHREERRPRRHLVGQPLSGRPGRHRQPLLLLLLRAGRSLDRVLLAASGTTRVLQPGHEEVGHRRLCRFNTEVTAATYDEPTGRWEVELRNADGETEMLDACSVISAVGALNNPHLPDIPGIDNFAGPSFHSARGTRPSTSGAPASPSLAQAPAASRSRRRSPTMSSN